MNAYIARPTKHPEVEQQKTPEAIELTMGQLHRFQKRVSLPTVAFLAGEHELFEAALREEFKVFAGAFTFDTDTETCPASGDGHPNQLGHK